jgi:uncharacterized protein with PQ loop repeat
MNTNYIKLIGYLATFFAIISLAPQAYKLYLAEYTADLSLLTFILIFLYSFSWGIYGLYNNDIPLIISQISLMLFSSYIVYKIIISNTSLTKDYEIFHKDIEYIKSLKWL